MISNNEDEQQNAIIRKFGFHDNQFTNTIYMQYTIYDIRHTTYDIRYTIYDIKGCTWIDEYLNDIQFSIWTMVKLIRSFNYLRHKEGLRQAKVVLWLHAHAREYIDSELQAQSLRAVVLHAQTSAIHMYLNSLVPNLG